MKKSKRQRTIKRVYSGKNYIDNIKSNIKDTVAKDENSSAKKLWNRICDLFSGGEDSNGNQKVHLKDIVCNIV